MKRIVFPALILAALVIAGASLLLLGNGEPLARAGQADLDAIAVRSDTPGAGDAPNCGSSGCGSSAGRSCCSPSSGQQSAAERVESIRAYLTAYYLKTMGGEIEVEVRDLGCHQEAEVRQGSQVIKRLSISGNSITEIS